MGRQDGGKDVVLRPRFALMLNVVGAVGFFAFWIVFRNVKGMGFESGSALVGEVWMLGLLIVVAIRPPVIHLRHDDIVIRSFGGSTEVDRKHYLGYTFRKAERIIGGESNSSTRGLFISYRLDNGSIAVVSAFWCHPLCGLLSAKEQTAFGTKLDHWHSEVSTAPVSCRVGAVVSPSAIGCVR
jgi:hypothetical protein